MPFSKGQSGNPGGRPLGARHKATLAAEALLDGEAEGLTRKAIEAALGGDMPALRICLDRILPPRKERPVRFKLPVSGSERKSVSKVTGFRLAPNPAVRVITTESLDLKPGLPLSAESDHRSHQSRGVIRGRHRM
jgi:hypothetical protein